MTFLIVGTQTSCAACGEVLASQSWRDRTAHACSRRTRLERADYTAALGYAGAVARLQTRCDTGGLGPNVGAESGMIEEQRRTAQRAKRRTVLSTPDRRNRKEDA